MNLRHSFFSFLLYLASSYYTFSQPLDPSKELTQYNIDHWEGEQAPSGVIDIVQASDGYLWLATLNGLVRFDGLKFTLFDKFSIPGIAATGFKCLYEDRQRNLWIGSNGSGLFLHRPNHFKRFEIPFGSGSNNIERVFQDSKGNLWLCTLKGLVKFKDSTFSLTTLNGQESNSDFPLYDITEDKSGALWIASANGILKYENGELKNYNWKGARLAGEVVAMHLDLNQNLWIASYGSGVYIAKNHSLKKVVEPAGFKHPVVIREDRNHSIWVGSEFGVARYKNGRLSYLESGSGLSNNNVNAICEDHEGSIWIGTYYGGLNRIREGAFTNYTVMNGLTHSTIHTIYQSHDGKVWAGAENDAAYLEDGTFKRLSKQFPELAGVRVRDIREDKNNVMWIASYDGVFEINKKTIKKHTVADGLSSSQARIIFIDDNGQVWVGTREGLNLWQNRKWKTYSVKDGLLNDFVMSVFQLHDGTKVVGTTDGVFKMKGEKFEPFVTDKGKLSGTIFQMHEDKENYLWIGTTTGLICINDGKLHNFSDTHKLLSGNVYQSLEDRLGALWLTTGSGIVRVEKKELIQWISNDTTVIHPRLFDKSSGLRTNEMTPTSHAMIAKDGTAWFPSLDGIAVIDPANILINRTPPPVIVERVMVGGREYDSFDRIVIPPGSRNIEVHYTGLSFMIPKKVNFRYMLNGYDKAWNEVGDRRIAYYTSLPPGQYTFSLAACNNDGVWNVQSAAVTFQVEKALWQTVPFYIMIVLVTGLLIFGMIDYRTRRVKQHNRELEEKIADRTREVLLQKEEIESQRDDIDTKRKELEKARNVIAEQYDKLRDVNENLEEKVEERTKELTKAYTDLKFAVSELDDFVYRSSHDIKGPLARLQGLCNLALIEQGTIPSREYLLLLQKESELANRVIEKLSHAHQTKNHKVVPSVVNLKKLLLEILEQLRLIHPEWMKLIQFNLNVDTNVAVISDFHILKEVLQNLLENTVVFKADETPVVNVSTSIDGENVSISIQDNGIGIHEKVKDQIFKMFVKGSERSQGLGLGLYIVKKGIELLKGSVKLKNSAAGSTEFEITLPLKYS